MVPNTHRVIIKPLPIKELKSSGIILPGQMKVGENLFFGTIEHPGDTKFKKGQEVFYSEYSAAALVDVRSYLSGDKSFAEISDEGFVVVAEDDIMAYYDDSKISGTTKKN